MNKILYISYDGMTDPLGQSQVLPYLIGLSKEYNIHLISFEKALPFKKSRATIEQVCNETGIVWHPLIYTKNPPILSTILDIFKMKKYAIRLHKMHSFSLVHTRSYIASMVGLVLKRKFEIPFLFDMRGFYADERVDGTLWNLKNPIYRNIFRFFKKKELQFFEESNAIVSLTENGKLEINKIVGRDISNKIMIIPCCADYQLFDFTKYSENERTILRNQLGINKDELVVSYLGSFGTWYLSQELLSLFKKIKEKKPLAKLLLISRDDPQIIHTMLDSMGINSEDVIIKSSDRKDVPKYIDITDLNIFFIKPVYSKKASSPTKLGEILGMGKPIICNTGVGDLDQLFSENPIGLCIDIDNDNAINKSVDAIDELLRIPKEKIRNTGLEHFNLESGVKKYKSIYNELIQ